MGEIQLGSSSCGDQETNTYDTIPHLISDALKGAGKRVPKVTEFVARICPICGAQNLGIINDTYVILCNAEGYYGRPGFMHGKIILCLTCGFIAEHIDESVLKKVREDLSYGMRMSTTTE